MFLQTSLQDFQRNLETNDKSQETIRSYSMNCKQFIEWIQEVNNSPVLLKQVKEEDIKRYMNMLKVEKGYKPSSINVALNSLRNLFQYATRAELIEKDPTQYVKAMKNHQERRDYLTANEIQTLLATITHELGNLVVRTLASTGLRINECLTLRLKDFDFENDKIFVRNGKGNKPRTIPISADLKPHLLRYKNGARKYVKNSVYFFATAKSGKISAAYVNRLLKKAVSTLGWNKHVTCHVLRHSFASHLIKQGTDLPTVAALLGHADFRTVTAVYIHIGDEELQSAVDQLAL